MALALSRSVQNVRQIMRHVRWFVDNSAEYYSKLPALAESGSVAGKL